MPPKKCNTKTGHLASKNLVEWLGGPGKLVPWH